MKFGGQDDPGSLQMLTNVLKQRVVDREFLCQTFFVAYSGCRKTVRNCAQSQTFCSNMLLPFDVCSPNDEREALKCGIGQLVIFENCLERASFPSMIQLHLGKPRCIERDRSLFASFAESIGVPPVLAGFAAGGFTWPIKSKAGLTCCARSAVLPMPCRCM